MSVVGPGVNRADERGVCGILGGRAPLIKAGAREERPTREPAERQSLHPASTNRNRICRRAGQK